MTTLGRRGLLQGAVLLAVVGFDPARRSWVTDANAHGGTCEAPQLEGELLTDSGSLDSAADDFGHIIHRRPIAVLRPRSTNDIVEIVRYAKRCGVKVAMRGQGHTTWGQAQVDGGILIDSSTMNRILDVTMTNGVLVEPGIRWRELLDVLIPNGLTPPVLPNYLDLTVGGNLSGGGVGGASHRAGAVVDNVLELEVVTGAGELKRCSPAENAALFNAVLGGLGQFAIIVKARLRTVTAPLMVRRYDLTYLDSRMLLTDTDELAMAERFDHFEAEADAGVSVLGKPIWPWNLLAAKFYTPPFRPDDGALLGDLHPTALRVTDVPYYDFLKRIDLQVTALKLTGLWNVPHPWFDMFLPGSMMKEYVGDIMSNLQVTDTGGYPILIYPMRKSRFTRPFVSTPNEELFYLFDVLTGSLTGATDPFIARNRTWYERGRDVGGKRYCIGSIPFSSDDWEDHFGTQWQDFVAAKERFDPDRILTPGQGIFA
jgi:cytokinin dehydrogenase